MDQLKEALAKLTWSTSILIIACWGGYSFYFQDRSEVEIRENSVASTQATIQKLKNKIIESEQFEKQYEKKKAELADLETKLRSKRAELPKTFNVPEMLNDLLFEAKQVGLEVKKITPAAAETKKELYSELSIDINTKGTFLQLFIFLDRLSKLKRLIGVTTVKVNSGGATEEITLKGTTGAMSSARLFGGEKSYKAINGTIRLLAFRIE